MLAAVTALETDAPPLATSRRNERGDRETSRRLGRNPDEPQQAEKNGRKDGNVPTGNGDDMIRSRFLQLPLIVVREPRMITDQDRNRDRRRLSTPTAHVARFRFRVHACRCRSLARETPCADEIDQRSALHRAEQHDSTPRQPALVVRNTRVMERVGMRSSTGMRTVRPHARRSGDQPRPTHQPSNEHRP